MIKAKELTFIIDNENNRHAVICPDEETILALMDLIKISNEAILDTKEDA